MELKNLSEKGYLTKKKKKKRTRLQPIKIKKIFENK